MGNLLQCCGDWQGSVDAKGEGGTEDPSVKVVHINGYVEEYSGRVVARAVTAGYPVHFLCHSVDLHTPAVLQGCLIPTLQPDDELKSSGVYFLLLLRSLETPFSDTDLASFRAKAEVAQRGTFWQRSKHKGSAGSTSVPPVPPSPPSLYMPTASRFIIRPKAGPTTTTDGGGGGVLARSRSAGPVPGAESAQAAMGLSKHVMTQSYKEWRPRLDPIMESSNSMNYVIPP